MKVLDSIAATVGGVGGALVGGVAATAQLLTPPAPAILLFDVDNKRNSREADLFIAAIEQCGGVTRVVNKMDLRAREIDRNPPRKQLRRSQVDCTIVMQKVGLEVERLFRPEHGRGYMPKAILIDQFFCSSWEQTQRLAEQLRALAPKAAIVVKKTTYQPELAVPYRAEDPGSTILQLLAEDQAWAKEHKMTIVPGNERPATLQAALQGLKVKLPRDNDRNVAANR